MPPDLPLSQVKLTPRHLVVYLYLAGKSSSPKTRYNAPFHHLCEGALSWYPTSFSPSSYCSPWYGCS
jgi:hypothetical protein